jgi:di-heme cytochrome c peroxidase
VAAALSGSPGYPELFRTAYGDAEITGPRIAMAIATYERSLVPDRTDYDRFVAGDTTALTPQEKRGLKALETSGCTVCHAPPLFTDNTFRNTGVRPIFDDEGRRVVSGNFDDGGRFKVPTLRNVALKRSFFHDGKRTSLAEAIHFYARKEQAALQRAPDQLLQKNEKGGEDTVAYGDDPDQVQFVTNQDPAMADIHLTAQDMIDIQTFLEGGLVDARVQDEVFPFDRPSLASEHPDLVATVAPTPASVVTAGSTVVATPAFIGNDQFRVGLTGVAPGTPVRLITTWPDAGSPTFTDATAVAPEGSDVGTATVFAPLPDVPAGTTLQFMWQTGNDVSGVLGSEMALVPVFEKRATSVAGEAREPFDPVEVGDANASVERATFRVDWAAHRRGASRDELRVVVRMNPRSLGTDLSAGRVSLALGAADVLSRVPLDAKGRLLAGRADGRFDPATGELVLSVSGANLVDPLVATANGHKGTISVPLTVTLQGLGLAVPTVSGDLAFDWRERQPGVVTGRCNGRDGLLDGAFRVTRIEVTSRTEALRVVARGALALRSQDLLDADRRLSLRIGTAPAVSLIAQRVADGVFVAHDPANAVRSLRIDTNAGTFSFVASVRDSALSTSAPGSLVPVRIRLDLVREIATYETTVDVRLP